MKNYVWAVVNKDNNAIVIIDDTRRDAYTSKKMLTDIYGGRYVVRKVNP